MDETEGRIETMERVFLGWDSAALPAAVAFLRQRQLQDGLWDLSGYTIAVPGGRAGRRLRELISQQAEIDEAVLFPPRLTTVGQVPELLYDRKRPFAPHLVQQLAWTAALRKASPDLIARFLAATSDSTTADHWFETGALLAKQHRELAGDGLNFADVAKLGTSLAGFSAAEADRWLAVSEVQRIYLQTLDKLHLWDRQTARLHAIDHHECHFDDVLILLGTVDMNRALRRMLDQLQGTVIALIHAPESLADWFDEHGCLLPEPWQTASMELSDESIMQVDRPSDQGQAVIRTLIDLQDRYTADQLTIGVPDETLVPIIQQQLDRYGVPHRWGPGRSVEASLPFQLLRCLVDYLQRRQFAELTELVRHPAVADWLASDGVDAAEAIIQFDQYHAAHLPVAVDPSTGEADGETPLIHEVVTRIDQWLAPLREKRRLPREWPELVLHCLLTILDLPGRHTANGSDDLTEAGCQQISEALQQLETLPEGLLGEIYVDEAVLLALEGWDQQQVPDADGAGGIEILGWLELPLDDTPALIVTSMNESCVPTSVNSDLFLPNQLRRSLGIDDNHRRYARDAYALAAMRHSRQELKLILGQHDIQGNPLPPSRLLLAEATDTRIARVQRLFGETSEMAQLESLTPSSEVHRTQHSFFVPRPRPVERPRSFRVTEFRDFLECPYRYYLSHRCKLRPARDDAAELNALEFGSLMHRVLAVFGDAELRSSDDADRISDALISALKREVDRCFGSDPLPAVLVQAAQMKQRLQAFAHQQAERVRAGWRIVWTEEAHESCQTDFDVDGESVELVGRIDRIDWHAESNQLAILDYKTSDTRTSPVSAHLASRKRSKKNAEPIRSGDWIDLQLPLYRHLIRELELPINDHILPQLGYIQLPGKLADIGFDLVTWSRDELKTADEAAREIIRAIWKQQFWPPTELKKNRHDDFAPILQVGVFGRQFEPPSVESPTKTG